MVLLQPATKALVLEAVEVLVRHLEVVAVLELALNILLPAVL
jgi:hypothetical protein